MYDTVNEDPSETSIHPKLMPVHSIARLFCVTYLGLGGKTCVQSTELTVVWPRLEMLGVRE